MRLIKLTESITSKKVYIVSEHLVSFWEEDGKTIVTTSNGDEIVCEETVEQIKKSISNINLSKEIQQLTQYAQIGNNR